PGSVIEMIAIAEETGRLDKELQRISLAYEGELDRNLRMLVSVAEPLMLIVTVIIIGVIVVAMLLPILTLQDVVHSEMRESIQNEKATFAYLAKGFYAHRAAAGDGDPGRARRDCRAEVHRTIR